MNNQSKKVFVGLSGGVDSSVSAYLLKEQGYDVTGVFIKAWYPDFLPCNWKSEMRDAMRVCAKLDIPFKVCDLEKEYKSEVIDYLINEYKIGRTPNPDVLCNREIKFGGFLKWAQDLGADYVATGHYAKRDESGDECRMLNSKDTEKDQTYFLWTITQDRLKHILFPLGDLEKSEVRKIAKKNNLHTASKKDSQGLCFIGHVDMKSFLRRYIDTKRGDVLNEEGEVIGYHDGAELYTIGERHGFTLTKKDTLRSVYYVTSKSLDNNTITVTDEKFIEDINISKVILENVSFTRESVKKEAKKGLNMEVRIRYRGELHDVKIDNKEGWSIWFNESINGVALGQSVVLYLNDECLGGGVVKSTK